MLASTPNEFNVHYVARRSRRTLAMPQDSHVEVLWSAVLEDELTKWKKAGFAILGLADVLAKANAPLPHEALEEQARSVGASLVLFCIWPAKLRSVQREKNGEIDLWRVVSDPPASFSPRSYSVARAMFLAPKNTPE